MQDQPGPNDSPAKFWRKVRRVLVDRMNDVSRRAATLAERSAACSHLGSELAQRISATTIQTESLYLDATRKAVRRTRSTDALSENLVAEVRQGLDHWSAVARRALAEREAAGLKAWQEWLNHCLRSAHPGEGAAQSDMPAQLEDVSRKLEGLGRACESLVQEIEACQVLALEIHGALPAAAAETPREA
ncbi:MAG: hypothetical protein GF355_09780 [Candidatus Eisenbacteria bacterium]|nr:hypothetical protein [Candidatus Eisenbacteria bacterium]